MRLKGSPKILLAVLLFFTVLGSTFVVSTSSGVTTITTETQTETSPATTISSTTTTTRALSVTTINSPSIGSISVSTNASSYLGTESISITGTATPAPLSGSQILVEVSNPNSQVIFADSVAPSPTTGDFSDSFVAGGSSFWVSGIYTVSATLTGYTAGSSQFSYAPIVSPMTTATTTVTSTTTTTMTGPTETIIGPTSSTTTTQTVTSTTTQSSSSVPIWAYAAIVVSLIVGLAVGYIIKRPTVGKP